MPSIRHDANIFERLTYFIQLSVSKKQWIQLRGEDNRGRTKINTTSSPEQLLHLFSGFVNGDACSQKPNDLLHHLLLLLIFAHWSKQADKTDFVRP